MWRPDLIPGIERFTGFVHLWHMPLLFLLAGWSLVASVRSRGGAAFVRVRLALVLGASLGGPPASTRCSSAPSLRCAQPSG